MDDQVYVAFVLARLAGLLPADIVASALGGIVHVALTDHGVLSARGPTLELE